MSRFPKSRHRTFRGLLAASGMALLAAIAGSVTAAQEPAAQAPQEPTTQAPAPGETPAGFVLAAGPGMADFQRACVLCHTPDRIVTVRRTKTEWEEVLDKMVTRGAQLTDDNYGPIADYLLRNYGKVNVNRAAKEDLVLIAGVAAAEAESIVKFRGEHGPFADFDALTKVPGLDVKKLDQKKEALTF
jgi:competence ComEA-like helix-hairpin-helix protein